MARVPATHDPAKEIGPHEAIADFLEVAWPEHLPWTHFPAGENRGDKVQRTDSRTGRTYWYSPSGARLKRMGLHPGWHDFQFVLPNGQFASAEVKGPGGDFTDDQKEHARKLRALGVVVGLWRSIEDCERDITRWLGAFGLKPRASTITNRGRT